MNWLNLSTETLDHETLAAAEDEPRSTWLHIMRYCIGQENGGRLVGCKDWNERKWMLLCRIKPEKVQVSSALWTWEGSDLLIWGYPKAREKEFRAKRSGARKANLIRWGKRSETGPPSESQTGSLSDSQSESRKERKYKGREEKEKKRGNLAHFAAEIYACYPKHVGKTDALKAIRSVLTTGATEAGLLEATRAYASAVASWPPERRKFVPKPAKWFRDGCFEDDRANWGGAEKSSSGAANGSSGPYAETGGVPVAN